METELLMHYGSEEAYSGIFAEILFTRDELDI